MNILKPQTYAILMAVFFLPTLTGCSTKTNPEMTKMAGNGKIVCTEPRTLICTRDYRPVCAESKRGHFRTYSNACTACSNPDIASYVDLTCPKDK
ncbi:hypothetical protein MNBD_GAMMA21-1869 [hydrothermal vent metagenome]|uniref:Kazal-like domain-containing protein n=1 Tax=hydrothermal vent metagenome TaxID=652676 RepID=A0A3B1B4E5_9ZZZZ